MSDPKLLVFGGSGFLGEAVLAAALAARPGRELLCVSRDPGHGTGPARRVRADALRDGEWEALLEAERPSAVILCTALSRGADCDRYPVLAEHLNVDLPRRVGAWCARSAARLVHVSTDLVFGASDAPEGGLDEAAPVAPVSLYGRTKAAGELALLEVCPAALVVRLPLLYGDSRGRGLGASDSLLAALERGEAPLLFEDEWRTPLDVDRAARALVELAGGERAGLLHVAGAERVSRHELGLAVLRARGEPDPASRVRRGLRTDLKLEAARPRDVSLDASRARELLDSPLPGVRGDLA